MLRGQLAAATNSYMKKLTPMSIRLDPDVRAAAEKRAADEERSISQIINRSLREAFGLSRKADTKLRSK